MKPKIAHYCTRSTCHYFVGGTSSEKCLGKCERENETNSLDRLGDGDKGVVNFVCSDEPQIFHKIQSMGIIPGSEVEVLSRAILGDPIVIKVLGTKLALLKIEARAIELFSK